MSDAILEMIFANPHVQRMTCIEQSNLIDVIETILKDIKEVNPYATISELLSPDE